MRDDVSESKDPNPRMVNFPSLLLLLLLLLEDILVLVDEKRVDDNANDAFCGRLW